MFFNGGVVLRIELLGLISLRALVLLENVRATPSWEGYLVVVYDADGRSIGLIFEAGYKR